MAGGEPEAIPARGGANAASVPYRNAPSGASRGGLGLHAHTVCPDRGPQVTGFARVHDSVDVSSAAASAANAHCRASGKCVKMHL